MYLLKSYLTNHNTQRVLKRKPGEKGFSLIELVVVIAVLAVLTAIALPNFLGVTEDASARTAQQGVLNAYKECKVYWARNKREAHGETDARYFNKPSITDWAIITTPAVPDPNNGFATGKAAGISGQPASKSDEKISCFAAGGAERDFYAVPVGSASQDKFPTYKISQTGERVCMVGKTASKETYNIGCDAASSDNAKGIWE